VLGADLLGGAREVSEPDASHGRPSAPRVADAVGLDEREGDGREHRWLQPSHPIDDEMKGDGAATSTPSAMSFFL